MDPREILRRVRRLEIRTRRLVEESLAGSYHSVFRGRGMEFAEVREYERGDDVRTIDWNVSARMGHPYVKIFTEERELTVVLAIDVSGSERFGTGVGTKISIAAEVSALLAFSAVRNNDRVGAVLFTDTVERFVPPRKGTEHGLRVLRDVLAAEARGRGTDLDGALRYVRNVVPKRAVVFLVSDFQDTGWERTLRVVARKHDILAIWVRDPRESVLPSAGLVAVEDPETGAVGLVDAGSRRVRTAWAKESRREQDRIRDAIRKANVDLFELSTDRSWEAALVRFFEERARRARRSGG